MKYVGFILDLFRDNRYADFNEDLRHFYQKINITEIKVVNNLNQPLLSFLYKHSQGFDAIVMVHSDSEFYNVGENQRLLSNFEKYGCDIGFGDDFPKGIVGEVVRRDALSVLENLRVEKGLKEERNLIHNLIHIDVNMFDLENLYAEINLHTLRLSFFSDNQQDAFVIKKIKSILPYKKGDCFNFSFTEMAQSIINHRHHLRTISKYFEVEISNQCEQACVFCPKTHLPKQEAIFMSFDDYKVILEKISSFSDNPTINFTGMGEALKNKDFLTILKDTLAKNIACFWETSACELTSEIADEILSFENQEKLLTIIFSIDAVDETLYKKLRPSKHSFKETLENIEYVLLRKRDNAYVQAVKMKDNFEHLVTYHHYFKRYTNNIIIQKYNGYKGFLEERRLNPMEPFEAIGCWHLKREMVVDVRGDVYVCKQDIKKEHCLGNLKTEPIQAIFDKGQSYFEKHLKKWDFCKNCDEYYTYNL